MTILWAKKLLDRAFGWRVGDDTEIYILTSNCVPGQTHFKILSSLNKLFSTLISNSQTEANPTMFSPQPEVVELFTQHFGH